MTPGPPRCPRPAASRPPIYGRRWGQGYADFLAFRSDVIVLCLVYPIAGSLLWRLASGHSLPQLIFPLVAGFALVGPLCATGLYEMSRRHELGEPITWASAFAAFRSPGIRSILTLGICLLVVFVAWLAAAELIYLATLGPGLPASFAALTHDVLFTTRGRLMTIIGIDVGFFFAVAVLCTTAIAFPLLLDRKVTVSQAVQASIRAALTNPREMALWGLIVAGLLVLGSAPFLVGLIVVVPVLGHGTWHLYRKLIPTAGNLDLLRPCPGRENKGRKARALPWTRWGQVPRPPLIKNR
ncbi:MAG: DUF2189 domain-containing protein [Rhodospirillales bacterium]